jgi:[acyl-carrier-protein] S-malonyltransferase
VQVINVNNPLSAVVSGPADRVDALLDAAKEAGALGARSLPVRAPYHSRLVEPAAAAFRDFLGGVAVRDAACDIVSHIDQRVVRRREDIVDLFAANISRPFDWLATMRALVALGTDTFVECGAGGSLRRVARFIEGDYRFLSMDDLRKAAAAGEGGGRGEGGGPP